MEARMNSDEREPLVKVTKDMVESNPIAVIDRAYARIQEVWFDESFLEPAEEMHNALTSLYTVAYLRGASYQRDMDKGAAKAASIEEPKRTRADLDLSVIKEILELHMDWCDEDDEDDESMFKMLEEEVAIIEDIQANEKGA
jgi:hypothetical protein